MDFCPLPMRWEANSLTVMIKKLLIPVGAALLLSGCATSSSPVAQTQTSFPSKGMVSAADSRAAQAGVEMLDQGGSATDAAIAVMLALTVVEPQSSGIGGGGFFLRGSQDGAIETLDGREKAAKSATPAWFLGDDGEPVPYPQALLTGLSIGVPGNVALAGEAHAKYGKLEWAALFQPAIALAENGFKITERFGQYLSFGKNRAGLTDAGKALFYDAAGEPLPVGTLVKNPDLAETLRLLAEQGPDIFYKGERAEEMASLIARVTPHNAGRTGAMTAEDVSSYKAIWRPAACGEYREYRICGMGPPSSGATTVFAILKQLEGFDLNALGKDSATSWHLFAESQRLAYADRELYLADSDYINVPVAGMMNGDYLRARGSVISASSRMSEVAAGTPSGAPLSLADGDEPIESGTSHFVTVDGQGNAVSYTSTVEGSFGSGHMFGGFYLNNELTDFSFRPEIDGKRVANRVEGGKRPRSSMSPTIVFGPDGKLVIAIGAAGGGTIPVQVAKALIGIIDWKLTPQDAIALPGLYSPGNSIGVEAGSALLVHQPALEALGHSMQERRMPFKANAAQLMDGQWLGAADPRSEGVAISQ